MQSTGSSWWCHFWPVKTISRATESYIIMKLVAIIVSEMLKIISCRRRWWRPMADVDDNIKRTSFRVSLLNACTIVRQNKVKTEVAGIKGHSCWQHQNQHDFADLQQTRMRTATIVTNTYPGHSQSVCITSIGLRTYVHINLMSCRGGRNDIIVSKYV